MNKAYFCGKIIEISDYKFFYNSKKHDSKISIKIMTLESNCKKGVVIELDSYDSIADRIYKIFKKGDIVFVEGILVKDMKVEILKINHC